MQDKSNQFAPVNSLGFQLPIIKTQEEEEENCRLSSDTFITSPAPPALSVIQEERSSQIAVSRSQLGSESIQQKEGETFTEKRTPARPRRSTISYTTQNIADIASSDEKIKEEKCLGEEASGGLMFFPISPDQSKGEKRKSDEGMGNRVAQEKKRIRAPEPKTLAAKAPVVVRAAKNPRPRWWSEQQRTHHPQGL